MSLLLLFNLDDGSEPPAPPPPASTGGGVIERNTYREDHQHLSSMTLLVTMSALVAAGVLQ